jgi:quercetin dioxygenase-like cupin family protein
MLERRNMGEPDEVRTFPHGRLEIVSLAGLTVGRAVFEPGWRWSEHVQPIACTDSCQVSHTAYVVSGRMHVRMDDGREIDLAAGDAHAVGPGHDAWVVGDEPLVVIDIVGAESFAREEAAPTNAGRAVACPCGVSFAVRSDEEVDHLVEAVQAHALHSHAHQLTRDQVLAETTTAVTALP